MTARVIKKIKRKIKPVGGCFFCKQHLEPDYKEIDILKKFISDRGKILSSVDTGVCHKHQRRLTQSIKRARFIALLPFIVRPT